MGDESCSSERLSRAFAYECRGVIAANRQLVKLTLWEIDHSSYEFVMEALEWLAETGGQ